MPGDSADFASETYLNPVYPHSFPDPFVLKFRGEYFAYCTGLRGDRKAFTILRSNNLVNWTEIGGAMDALDNDAPHYWAPEVTYSNGKFYLYYSVGNETFMEIRVGVSDSPEGGFVDSGRKLTTEQFAIDAHVFTDDDGKKYLFYATDFLVHSHIGTGLVVDKMIDFFTLEGNPQPVARAKFDWQIYDPNRIEKGGVRWHTVEGAFVLKRKNTYFLMFSGGNWQNISYGVSFAVSDSIEKREEWTQFSNGETVLPILRTLPEKVVGPGHNSVVRGLNNRELFCVYHCWTGAGRVLAIDRLNFAGNRIFIIGATYTPQIAPFQPTLTDFFDNENSQRYTKGEWNFGANEASCGISEHSELIYQTKTRMFLCEFSFRCYEIIDESGSVGFYLADENRMVLKFSIFPMSNQVVVDYNDDKKQKFELPNDFNFQAYHLLRVEVDGLRVKISLDENVLRFDEKADNFSTKITLAAEKIKAAFSGFALSDGFEDLFDWKNDEPEENGWQNLSEHAVCRLDGAELSFENRCETDAFLTKGFVHASFEFAANLRLTEIFGEDCGFGFVILNDKNETIARLNFKKRTVALHISDGNELFDVPLPTDFPAEVLHQFILLRFDEKLIIQIEGVNLGEISLPNEHCKVGIFCRNSKIALEMTRLTVL